MFIDHFDAADGAIHSRAEIGDFHLLYPTWFSSLSESTLPPADKLVKIGYVHRHLSLGSNTVRNEEISKLSITPTSHER